MQATDIKLSILERVSNGDILISDGATGTYLMAHGLESGACPELMNITMPDVIKKMAETYFSVGSNMVLTNSFGGNRFGLDRYGFGDRVREFNNVAAELACSAAPIDGYVAGSVGPTGVFMRPVGEVTEQEMTDVFAEQTSALAEGGVDAVLIETMISTEEACVAVKAAKEATNISVMATVTFDKGPRGLFTMMGQTPEDAVRMLAEAGADIVGTNCGNGIEVMIELVTRIKAVTDKPLLVHSNAGVPRIVKGAVIYPESPEFMAPRFKELTELGVSIVGGCCGTTPDHISACVKAVRDSG